MNTNLDRHQSPATAIATNLCDGPQSRKLEPQIWMVAHKKQHGEIQPEALSLNGSKTSSKGEPR